MAIVKRSENILEDLALSINNRLDELESDYVLCLFKGTVWEPQLCVGYYITDGTAFCQDDEQTIHVPLFDLITAFEDLQVRRCTNSVSDIQLRRLSTCFQVCAAFQNWDAFKEQRKEIYDKYYSAHRSALHKLFAEKGISDICMGYLQ